jgi:hypothetical protein
MGQKKKAPSKRKGAGRPTRKDLGLDPTIAKTVRVEKKVIELLEKKHGTLSNALRAVAGQ